jgi:hypothetical protein
LLGFAGRPKTNETAEAQAITKKESDASVSDFPGASVYTDQPVIRKSYTQFQMPQKLNGYLRANSQLSVPFSGRDGEPSLDYYQIIG